MVTAVTAVVAVTALTCAAVTACGMRGGHSRCGGAHAEWVRWQTSALVTAAAAMIAAHVPPHVPPLPLPLLPLLLLLLLPSTPHVTKVRCDQDTVCDCSVST